MNTWCIDFEYSSKPGEPPRPWCVVGRCVETGEVVRVWLDGKRVKCPFPAPHRLVAHYAMAELGCYEALGWEMPEAVVDTLAEARTIRGQRPIGGWGLLSCCHWAGLQTMSSEHKDGMRELAMGDQVPPEQREDLIDYCQSDVEALAGLWRFLRPHVDLPLAELRGRYLIALTRVETRGIPVDVGLVTQLRDGWDEVKSAVRAAAVETYPGVLREDGSFASAGWGDWCRANQIHWPELASGSLALDEETFKKMADRHPEVRVMSFTRKMLGQTKPFQWPLGPDGRLRCMLSPFGSDTGRNQPSTSKYIFGAPSWMRRAISAPRGSVLAYVDFSSQEFALAAALSGDRAMIEDYACGDPYIGLAVRAGAVPPDATKGTHPKERTAFKVTTLAVGYGMGPLSLAGQLGLSLSGAERLIRLHKKAYPRFWDWKQNAIDEVVTGGTISTKFGWRRSHRGPSDRPTSIGNFLTQAGGAETLRLSVIALEEAGFRVVAPVHDAVLVELSEAEATAELAEVRRLMERAGETVTGGLTIRTDADVIPSGGHFEDARGTEMWELLEGTI